MPSAPTPRRRGGPPALAEPTPLHRAMRGLHVEARRRASATGTPPLVLSGPVRMATPADPVAAALAGVETGDPLVGLLAELRAAVTRYVRGLRAAGARPEQMIVRVKAHVRDVMAADAWHDPAVVQTLTSHVVTWSIAAYYDP